MQLLEIAKAISTESKVLILDEPTATLTPKEITLLFEIISKLKARGLLSSTSPTGCRKRSRSAIASPCSETAGRCARRPFSRSRSPTS